jgi:hypothetical protein
MESELVARQKTAAEEWFDSRGRDRQEFALAFGQFGHERFAERIIERENMSGRKRNVHYGVEYELKLPDGTAVRYDYVDLEQHLIIDYKSAKPGQAEEQVAQRYREQRQRHIDAYVATFGVVPTYRYQTYPSSTALYAS